MGDDDRISIPEFIKKHNIVATITLVNSIPDRINALITEYYEIEVFIGSVFSENSETFDFRMNDGNDNNKDNILRLLFTALAQDCSYLHNMSGWEQMAEEFYMELDDARIAWEAIEDNDEKLQNLLDDEAYEELLWKTK